MTTLRVRLPAPFGPTALAEWWRVDAAGRAVDRGEGNASSWPAADRLEAVLGAETVRIVAVALPPVPEARRASAVAYALEDRLAARAEDLHVCAPNPGPGNPTLARIVDRPTMASLARHVPAFDRVIAEPDLVDDDQAWHWCADARGRGFVRRPDGSAFATGGADPAGRLPVELRAALDEAARAGQSPERLIVETGLDVAGLSHDSGVRFARGPVWGAERQPESAWRRAPDLLEGYRTGTALARPPARGAWTAAFALLFAALAVQAVGSLGLWARDRYQGWRAEREVVELARSAGIDAADAVSAASALARRATVAAHLSGRAAVQDLLPLLARSSPMLAALPAGSVRRIAYADGRLTADLAGVDEARATRLVRELAQSGLRPVSAPMPGGVRVAVVAGP